MCHGTWNPASHTHPWPILAALLLLQQCRRAVASTTHSGTHPPRLILPAVNDAEAAWAACASIRTVTATYLCWYGLASWPLVAAGTHR
jgi:hypothetical protein